MGGKRTDTAKRRMTARWYPKSDVDDFDTEPLEYDSLQLMGQLIRDKLKQEGSLWINDPSRNNKMKIFHHNDTTTTISNPTTTSTTSHNDGAVKNNAYTLAKGQFQDLCSTMEGSIQLENLFHFDYAGVSDDEEDGQSTMIIWGAIYSLQSLCLLAMSVGVKGTETQRRKGVQHLLVRSKGQFPPTTAADKKEWITRLKYNFDLSAGTQLLATLQKLGILYKRSAEGAKQVLQALCAWQRHEPIALLRSGFPIAFDFEEQQQQAEEPEDIDDTIFSIRQDLTHLKVFTIDSSTAQEIDDALSVEKLVVDNDDDPKYRYWIHIADAHRWCTKELWDMAQERIITHYLPTHTIPMFPPSVVKNMSLQPGGKGCCALSLGVILSEKGDIIDIEVSLSKVEVTYRLSYDEVNDMLAEGVAYQEEWELGNLLDMAKVLRQKRIAKGCMEGMVPRPIPRANVDVTVHQKDDGSLDDGQELDISLSISTNNMGANMTSTTTASDNDCNDSNLLVTEFMILAGEALGAWKLRYVDATTPSYCGRYPNTLTLLFRKQDPPKFLQVPGYDHFRELSSQAAQAAATNADNSAYLGYCQAWYAIRFLSPAQTVTWGKNFQHYGLGIDQYCQWTSPIRRLGDLQVHASVKRYLRRQQINEWMYDNSINLTERLSSITAYDLGCPVPGRVDEDIIDILDDDDNTNTLVVDQDFNYLQGTALVAASRRLSKELQTYWLYEYLSRRDSEERYQAVILGCTDIERNQYAVYVMELGLQHKMLLDRTAFSVGEVITVQVQSVNPTQELLTLAPVL
eukprot:CAMPEP_0194263988 /NCGR_PEP_ID=MMETSP0158-20130606/47353_1 /TAXON_ID=33649 /ORGANISM="Thalassionema nitzschioides, Strain L26-B" /LENGTH=796 /DNA_ID=CAMNT_0039004215 /DNA_START=196 /DNA_END=2586 /DNA_ORIENTATION=-